MSWFRAPIPPDQPFILGWPQSDKLPALTPVELAGRVGVWLGELPNRGQALLLQTGWTNEYLLVSGSLPKDEIVKIALSLT